MRGYDLYRNVDLKRQSSDASSIPNSWETRDCYTKKVKASQLSDCIMSPSSEAPGAMERWLGLAKVVEPVSSSVTEGELVYVQWMLINPVSCPVLMSPSSSASTAGVHVHTPATHLHDLGRCLSGLLALHWEWDASAPLEACLDCSRNKGAGDRFRAFQLTGDSWCWDALSSAMHQWQH